MIRSYLMVLATLCVPSLAFGANNLLANPGAELGIGVSPGTVTGWTLGGDLSAGRDDGTFNPGINPHSGGFAFYGRGGTLDTLTQNVDLLANGIGVPTIDSGVLSAFVGFFEQSLVQGATGDAAAVQLVFRDAALAPIGSGYDSGLIYSPGAWLEVTGHASIPVGTRSIDYVMSFTRRAGADLDSYIDDNSLSVAVPEPASFVLASLGIAGLFLVRRRSSNA